MTPDIWPEAGTRAAKDIKRPINLLREEIALPAAVVYQSRLENNLLWMQRFAQARHVHLAPHGKTTMTPRFFQLQQEAGAWGLSLATVPQAKVAADAGIQCILMANQLVGKQNMQVVSELLAHPSQPPLEFYCLVDSVDNVKQLGEFFAARGQSLQVLLEIGVPGGRCGCRSAQQIQDVCQAVAAQTALKLAGVETYEGMVRGADAADRIRQHLVAVRDTALQLLQQGYFDTEQIILTGAGSAWYDIVAEVFTDHDEPRLVPVLRPGCYLIHDRGIYLDAQSKVMARLGDSCSTDGDLISSLEVWAYVQSVPEPGMAILTLGKRNAAFDAGLPQPVLHFRPGDQQPRKAPADWQVASIMDQHSIMRFSVDTEVSVGDIIALSTSHPCLTFDKWRTLLIIDDDYNLLESVPTFF
jgi:D-serine dehydratase